MTIIQTRKKTIQMRNKNCLSKTHVDNDKQLKHKLGKKRLTKNR